MIRVWRLQPEGARPLPPEALEGMLQGEGLPVWVDVQEGTDAEWQRVQVLFGLHPLEVEDARTFTELPKLEEQPGHTFLVTHAPALGPGLTLRIPELNLFWNRRFALTAHQEPVEAVEEAARAAEAGLLPGVGPDFVVHAVLDRAVSAVVPLVERLAQEREKVEETLLELPPHRQAAERLQGLRRTLQRLRHSLGPLRFAVDRLGREDARFVSQEARPYFRDAADETARVVALIEHELMQIGGAFEVYLSQVSAAQALAAQRTNEVMRKLTVITSVFLPISFIAGVYGMNFRYMPELGWRWGYPFALGLMALTALTMLAYFRRQGWL